MIKLYKLNDDAIMPKRGTEGAAGYDLFSLEDGIEIYPGKRVCIPTGIMVEMPPDRVGLIWPRSGLASNHGIDVLAGVIDADYRGEILVILLNTGVDIVKLGRAKAMAQVLFTPVDHDVIEGSGPISETSRGNGALGSTDE